MESTSWYDNKGSRTDMNGTEVHAIPRITRNEPSAHMVKSSAKFSNKEKLMEVAWVFYDQTGKLPKRVYSSEPAGALVMFSMKFGTTTVNLSVEYGANEYHASAE